MQKQIGQFLSKKTHPAYNIDSYINLIVFIFMLHLPVILGRKCPGQTNPNPSMVYRAGHPSSQS